MTRADPARLGVAAGVAAVTAWGLGAVISKHIELSGVALAFHRMWISAAVYTAVVRLRRARLSLEVLRRSTPPALAFAANVACFFTAVKTTTVANATIIGALQPVLTLALAGRFGERPDRLVVGGTAAGLAGVVLVIVGSSGRPEWSPTGDLFAVGAVVSFTAYFALAKRARAHLGALELQWGAQVVAAAALAPVVAVSGQSFALPVGADVAWLALLIAVPGSGHLLMNWAHAHVPLTVTSMLTLAVPVVSASAAAVFLGEAITPLQVAGALVVLAALGAVVARASRPAPPLDVPPAPSMRPGSPPDGDRERTTTPRDGLADPTRPVRSRPPPDGDRERTTTPRDGLADPTRPVRSRPPLGGDRERTDHDQAHGPGGGGGGGGAARQS